MKLLINQEKIWYADIYATSRVLEGEYLEEKDMWVAKKLCKEAIPKLENETSLVLELKNKKFIDLAEVDGVADYLILSTCAKLNIDNERLMTWKNGEDCTYMPDKKYVKYLRFCWDVNLIELKEAIRGSGMITLKELTTKAGELRKRQNSEENSCGK